MAAAREIKAREVVEPGDDDAVELAKRHLVQPWPYAGSVGAEARALIGEGEGIYITDASGKRLIDGPAGMWCINVGHRREELARVMYDQAMALSYNTPWYTMNAPSAELARRIADAAPGDLSHTFFTTGGSSAVETALRFMQFYNNVRGRPEKKLILSRGGAYHGSTYLSASLNGRPRDRHWMDGADELVIKLSSPDPFRRPKEMSIDAFTDFLVDQFRDTVARVGAGRIGAFVGEPVQASGGVVVPPDGYLKRIREICRENDILYVSDEVVTGFGRLGTMFGSDHYGIKPDLITIAKGLTSAYAPLSGVIVSDKVWQVLVRGSDKLGSLGHGWTYSAHPICVAAGVANLELIDEMDLVRNAGETGAYFRAELTKA
ncbi:MAG: aminotransferase class III-fold pyridoxal phosphate-dependent enzyme, partial [Mesorhizobium sp.]